MLNHIFCWLNPINHQVFGNIWKPQAPFTFRKNLSSPPRLGASSARSKRRVCDGLRSPRAAGRSRPLRRPERNGEETQVQIGEKAEKKTWEDHQNHGKNIKIMGKTSKSWEKHQKKIGKTLKPSKKHGKRMGKGSQQSTEREHI